MNKILSLVITIIMPFAVAAQAWQTDSEPKPSETIKFAERVYDFGTILEADGPVTHEFEFTNSGSKPVTILYVRGGCVSISGEAPRKPVAPGQKAKVKVTFNPAYRPGDFSKEVVVMNSDKEFNRVWVKGHVEEMKHPVSENYPYDYGNGLWMNLGLMSFAHMESGETKSVRLRLANDSSDVLRLRFEADNSALPDGAQITIPESFILQPGDTSEMKITIHLTRSISGEHSINVYPVINGTRGTTPLEVRVYGK